MVEHVIGNDGVESPILFSGTNAKKPALWGGFFALIRVVEADFRKIAPAIRKCGAEIAERNSATQTKQSP